MNWRQAVAAGVLAVGCAQAVAAPPSPRPGSGEELTGTQCVACHTADYIVMNSVFLTSAQWQTEVARMRTVFGASMDDSTAAAIAAYLAAHYAVAAAP